MAISIDAFNGSPCSGFSATALTLAAFTVGATANELVVGIIYQATNTTNVGSTSVTYNGVALSSRISAIQTNKAVIELWTLKAPATGSHAVAVGYSNLGTFQNVGIFFMSLKNVLQTTDVAGTNSGSEAAVNNATFPNFVLNISGGSWGLAFGNIKYSAGFDGPPDTSSPFSTITLNNGAMPNSGGASTPGNDLFVFTGAYDGLTHAWTAAAHQSGAYDDIIGLASFNALPETPPKPPLIQPAPSAFHIVALDAA